ncbi:MAG TPA: ATP-binding protein [Actinomycetota bacterium]
MTREAFELELPPSAEHLGTARSFAAALARSFGASGESIEDLKLAVSEACTDAITSDRRVRIRALLEKGALGFEIDAPDDPGTAEGLAGTGAPSRVDLVRTLFPDATSTTSGDRRMLRFSLPLR